RGTRAPASAGPAVAGGNPRGHIHHQRSTIGRSAIVTARGDLCPVALGGGLAFNRMWKIAPPLRAHGQTNSARRKQRVALPRSDRTHGFVAFGTDARVGHLRSKGS